MPQVPRALPGPTAAATRVSPENVFSAGPSQGFDLLTANPLNVNRGKVVLGDNRKGGPDPREVRLGKLGTDNLKVQNPSPALLILSQLSDTQWTTSTTLTTILGKDPLALQTSHS